MNFQLQKRASQANARWRTMVRFTMAHMERVERVVQELLSIDPKLMFRIVVDDDTQDVVTYCINGQWRQRS